MFNCYYNIRKILFNMKKELLTKLKEVFAPTDIPMPKPEVELTEKIK